MPRIAIIGAGLSGLTVARALQDVADVSVFEKSRGVSGRMSTRYADPFQFDHGAQYFTARTAAFQTFLSPFIEQGTVTEWQPNVLTLEKGNKPYKRDWFEPHYVATPRMNSLCKALAEQLDVHVGMQITDIQRSSDGWQLASETESIEGLFDWVVVSAPAPQSAALLPPTFAHHTSIDAVTMTACYSMMLGYDAPLPFSWQAAVVRDSPITWISVNSSKPGRETATSLMVQTSNDWAEKTIDDDREQLTKTLISECVELMNLQEEHITHHALHGWRYATTTAPAGQPFLLDLKNQLAACGDWCIESRVEAAFTSGYELANAMLSELKND